DPFTNALWRGSALNASDFADEAKAMACCQALSSYQFDRIANEFSEDDELRAFTGSVPRPAAIFAPYFYIEPSNATEWLDLVLRLAAVTASAERRLPVHAILCVDESFLLEPSFIARLKAEIPPTGVKGVWFWFSRLTEDRAPLESLKALRSLVEDLSETVQVFNMHGGYLSLAMCKFGMAGTSHGVGYGEQKDVLPIIGQSTPTVRYYLPPVHKRFGVPDIQRCFLALDVRTPQDFHEQVCDCVICKGVVSENLAQFAAFGDMHRSRAESKRLAQTPAAAKRCRFHFLLCRIRERNRLKDATVTDIVQDLESAKAKWRPQPSMRTELEFLDRWISALG
ncbi:MAG: hypothetical protein B7Z73_16830, partial [Planctomycetia bacterium 21-64-5]